MCVCVYIYICIYIYVYMYTYIYIYIYIYRSKYCVALVKYVGQERYKIVLKVCEKVHDVSGLNPSSGVRKMQLTVDTVNKTS